MLKIAFNVLVCVYFFPLCCCSHFHGLFVVSFAHHRCLLVCVVMGQVFDFIASFTVYSDFGCNSRSVDAVVAKREEL